MLLIILLGVFTKLVVVSADCITGAGNRNLSDWTGISGTWYWLYHVPQKYNENLDCPVTTFEPITTHFGRLTTYVYVKRTKTRHRIVGTLTDWNTNEYTDIYYPEPKGDANCAADGNCNIKPGYASTWSGKYRMISLDHKRYAIFEYCCKKLETICIYTAFRTPNPDEETLNEVKRVMKENGLDFNQLVKWETNHC